MQIGCCAPIDKWEVVKAAGYDYMECTVTSLVGDQDDEAFAPVLAQYQASQVPVKAFNVFLPGDLKITGSEVNWERIKRYVTRALARVALVGGQTVVFGSGGARRVPDGFDRATAEGQIVKFLQFVGDVAARHGITIAIEPLNTKESNVLTSVTEGYAMAKRVNRPAVKLLADFYHMDEEKESLAHLYECRDLLSHIHVADTGRLAPMGVGQYPYAEFVQQLTAAGYDGTVSVECRWGDFEAEAGPACQFLRQTLRLEARSA